MNPDTGGTGYAPAPPADPPRAPERGRGARLADWAPVLVAALPFVVLLVVSVVQAHQLSHAAGDLAVLELRTRAASHFAELLGPYSRYGWDHPGPVAFYWAAPFYVLAGDRPGGLAVATVASNLLWVVLLVAAARRAAGVRAAWLATATVLGFVAVLGVPWLRQAWNPFQVILPVAAVAVLGAATWAGVRWALPAAVVSATWAIQTHVGTAAVVLIMVALTVLPALWTHRRSWAAWRGSLAASLALGVVLWLPPLIDQVQHRPGNLRTLVRFFRASAGTSHPFHDVLRLVAPQLSLTSTDLGGHLGSNVAHFRPISPGELLVLAALLAFVAFGAWRARAAGDHFRLGCCLAALGGSLGAVASTRAAAGDLLPYFTSFSSGVGIVVWFAALLTAADLAAPRLPTGATRRPLSWGAAGGLVVVALLLGVAGIRARSYAHISNHPDVGRLATATERALGSDVDSPVLLVVGKNRPWPQAAGLAAELERRGVDVRTAKPWVFLFGHAYRPRGNEVVGLLVLGAHDGHFPKPPPGAVLVGQADIAQVWKLPARSAARAAVGP